MNRDNPLAKLMAQALHRVLGLRLDEPEPAPTRPPAPSGEPSRFEALPFVSLHGLRQYKLFVPSGLGRKPVPLVVMLHGCTQDPDDFAAGTRMNEWAQKRGFLVLYPEQAPHANAHKCWNWFRTSDQQRGSGEPELLAAMTRQVMQEHPVDAKRVYVAGLSAGGAMAAILAQAYPDLYAAAGVHSGVPHGAADNIASAYAVMQHGPWGEPAGEGPVPMIIFHGDQDNTVHPRNGEHFVAGLDASERRVGTADGGRSFEHTLYRNKSGRVSSEHWVVHGAGHAWSGGHPDGSYTDEQGPDATREMLRFFEQNRRA